MAWPVSPTGINYGGVRTALKPIIVFPFRWGSCWGAPPRQASRPNASRLCRIVGFLLSISSLSSILYLLLYLSLLPILSTVYSRVQYLGYCTGQWLAVLLPPLLLYHSASQHHSSSPSSLPAAAATLPTFCPFFLLFKPKGLYINSVVPNKRLPYERTDRGRERERSKEFHFFWPGEEGERPLGAVDPPSPVEVLLAGFCS